MSFIDALTGRLPGLMAAGFAGNNVAQQERYRREQAAIQQARQQQEFEAEMRRKAIEEAMLRGQLERQPVLYQQQDQGFARQQDKWRQEDEDRAYSVGLRPQQEQATGLAIQKAVVDLQQAQRNLENTRTPEQENAAKLRLLEAESRLTAARQAAASGANGMTIGQQIQLIRDAGTAARDTEDNFLRLKRERPRIGDFTPPGPLGVPDSVAYNAALKNWEADTSSYSNRLRADRARYQAAVQGLYFPRGTAASEAAALPPVAGGSVARPALPAPADSAPAPTPRLTATGGRTPTMIDPLMFAAALGPNATPGPMAPPVGTPLDLMRPEIQRLQGDAAAAPDRSAMAIQIQREAQQVVAEIMADATLTPANKQARVQLVGQRLAAALQQLGGAPQ